MALYAMQIPPLFQKNFEPRRNEILDAPLDVSNLTSQLNCGKAVVPDDLCAALLSMCFTLFLYAAICLYQGLKPL